MVHKQVALYYCYLKVFVTLVQAAVLLAPKLSSATLNNQLLKSLAKCQLDEQPSIRTNTNICLGKIAGYLSPSVSEEILHVRGCIYPHPLNRHVRKSL